MNRTNIVIGFLFIIFGIILGISLLTNINFQFWPIFVLILGLIFEISYFRSPKKSNSILLVPGGILTVMGILFLYQTITDWKSMNYLWPVLILALAIVLFQFYIFGKKDKGLLAQAWILTGLFLIFTLGGLSKIKDYFKYIGPLVIIIIGVIMVLIGKTRISEP